MASVGVFNHNNVEVWRGAKLNSCGDNHWASHCPHLNTKAYLSGRTEEGFQQFPDYNEDSLYYSINGQWINESFAIRLRANIPVAWCMLGKKDKYSDFRYQNLTICMVFQGINEVEKWCNQKKKKKKILSSPQCRWEFRLNAVVHKIFLELNSKTAVQHSPNRLK